MSDACDKAETSCGRHRLPLFRLMRFDVAEDASFDGFLGVGINGREVSCAGKWHIKRHVMLHLDERHAP